MSNLSRYRQARRKPDFDDQILPLINIVFLLLAFFLVAGQLDAHSPVEISPPLAGADAPVPSGPVTLYLDRDGVLYHGDVPVPDSGLAALMSAADPNGQTLLIADADVGADMVLDVLTRLKGLGHANTRLVTRTDAP